MNVECDSTCKQILLAYLNIHSPDNCPLPDSSKLIMAPMLMAITEVPTKHFLFKCERLLVQRRPRGNAFTVILESQNTGNCHLPPARVKSVMNAHDTLYNHLRQLLKDHKLGFSANLAPFVGDGFLRHLSSTFFPLGLSAKSSLTNDRHNRVGPVPAIQSLVHSLGERPLDTKQIDHVCLPWFRIYRNYGSEWGIFSRKTKIGNNSPRS